MFSKENEWVERQFFYSAYCFALQTEEFPALEEGDEGTASQSVAMDQEVTLSQSDTPDQLEREVIVIVTDTESEEDQEEEEEEEEEQVECFCWAFKRAINKATHDTCCRLCLSKVIWFSCH